MFVLLAQHQDMLLDSLTSYVVKIDPTVKIVSARNWSDVMDRTSGDARYDLVVVDLELPGLAGLGDVLEQRRKFGDAAVVVLAQGATREDVLWSLDSGIAAYLTKDMRGPVVLGALMLAMHGERFIPSNLLLNDAGAEMDGQPDYVCRRSLSEHPMDAMTQRQAQVLKRVAAGKTNAEIAKELEVAEPTVRLHLRHIYRKLGVRNRIEAVRVALRLDPRSLRP